MSSRWLYKVKKSFSYLLLAYTLTQLSTPAYAYVQDFTNWENVSHGSADMSTPGQVHFNGYTTNGFGDYIIYNTNENYEKEFSFTLDETAVFYHSFRMGGFLMCMENAPTVLKGYGLAFNEDNIMLVKLDTFPLSFNAGHHTPDILQIIDKPDETVHKFKVNIIGNQLKVWLNGTQIFDYFMPEVTGHSFGVFALHAQHDCEQRSHLVFKDLNMKLETLPPTLNLVHSPSSWTNQDVTINATASDGESSIYGIVKPDGTEVRAASTSYTVRDNGTYTFKAYDEWGNEVAQSITVSNIDRDKPSLSLTQPSTYGDTVMITASGSDTQSGIDYITLPNGQKVYDSTATFTATANTTYNFSITDKAGNTTSKSITVNKVNKKITSISHPPTATGKAYQSFSELSKPNTVTVTLDDGSTTDVTVSWVGTGYDKVKTSQTLAGVGTLSIPTGVSNPDNLRADLNIQLDKVKLLEVHDTQSIYADYGASISSLAIPTHLAVNIDTSPIPIHVPVRYDTSTYNPNQLGEQIFKGTLDFSGLPVIATNVTQNVFLKVTVTPAEVQTIEVVPLITQEAYTPFGALGLPTTLRFTFKNQFTGKEGTDTCQISWQEQDYNKTNISTIQTIHGTLNLPSAYVNTGNIQALGTIQLVPAQITGLGANVSDTLYTKGKLGDRFEELPTQFTVTVQLDSGVTFDLTPVWDSHTYDFSLYHQVLPGHLSNLPDWLRNPHDVAINLDVTLDAVPGGTELIRIPVLETLKVNKGTAIENIPYLYRVNCMLSSGEFIDIDVSYWDSSNADTHTLGNYEATAILLPGDYENKEPLVLKQPIQVVECSDKDIAEVMALPPIEVIPGMTPTLPDTVKAILKDGSIIDVPISFPPTAIDTTKPGVVYIQGTLDYPDNPLGIKPIQEVDVIDIFKSSVSITKVLDTPNIQAPLHSPLKELPIPNAVRVRLSDNRWAAVTPDFSTSNYDQTSLDLQTFNGQLSHDTSILNPLNLQAYTNIKLFEKVSADDDRVVSIFNPTCYTVPYHTPANKIGLPNPKVQLKNGEITTTPAPWTLEGYRYDRVGVQIFHAQVDGLDAILHLNVLPDPRDPDGSLTIEEITMLEDITIKKGEVLRSSDLPATITVTLRNKTQMEVPIIWDYTAKSISRNIKISGTLAVPNGMFCTEPLDVIQKVICKKEYEMDEKPKKDVVEPLPTPTPVPTPIPTPVPEVVPEVAFGGELESEQYLIDTASAQIPYTLPHAKVVNWQSIVDFVDFKRITITPEKFFDETIVDINLATAHIDNSVKSQVVKPEPATVNPFKDVPKSHWAYNSIMELIEKGYIKGTDSEVFSPKNKISVADTFTFMDRILVDNSKLKMRNRRPVVDALLSPSDHWAYYSTASIISKIPTETAQHFLNLSGDVYTQEFTREQVAIILYGILTNYDIQSIYHTLTYEDTAQIIYKDEVNYCTALGLFEGDNNGNFNPNTKITRAELLSVLLRLDEILQG